MLASYHFNDACDASILHEMIDEDEDVNNDATDTTDRNLDLWRHLDDASTIFSQIFA